MRAARAAPRHAAYVAYATISTQLPWPPHVPRVSGNLQSAMFLFEQGSLAAHPVALAEGSQSCASLSPHEALHDELVVLLLRDTQHTVPGAQLAWLLHLSAVGAFPPLPPGFGHVAPATHAWVKPFPARVTQQVSAGILQVDAPHVRVAVVPVEPPPSTEVVPPSEPVEPPSEVPPPESAPLPLAEEPPSADVSDSKSSPEDPPHATSVPPTTNDTAKNL